MGRRRRRRRRRVHAEAGCIDCVAQQRVHQAVRGNALGWRADGQSTWSGGNLHGCLNHTADNSAAFDAGLSDDLSIMCWRQFHCRE